MIIILPYISVPWFVSHTRVSHVTEWSGVARECCVSPSWAAHLLTMVWQKGSNVPVHAVKTYRGRRGVSPLIPKGGTKTSPVGCAPRSLYRNGKNHGKTMMRRLSGDSGEEIKLVYQPTFEPRFVSRISAAVPTEVSQWRHYAVGNQVLIMKSQRDALFLKFIW
jgi:hypothetical protein